MESLDSIPRLVIPTFFARFSEHSAAEHFVAQKFVDAGASVLIVECNRDLKPRCLAMGIEPLSQEDSNAICEQCTSIADLRRTSTGYESTTIGAWLDANDQDFISREIAKITPLNWRDYEVEGVPLGKMWSYNTAVEFKSTEFSSDNGSWNHFKETAKGNLAAFLSARKLSRSWKPDAALIYSFEYSTNRSFLAGLGPEVKPYTFHQVVDHERFGFLKFSEASKFGDFHEDDHMSHLRSFPLSKREGGFIRRVINDTINARNIFAYSTERRHQSSLTVLKALGLDGNRPVITVLTSSPDEVDAGNLAMLRQDHRLFDDDLELCRLIGPLADRRKDVDFLVRIHPRLLPNRRDNLKSSRADEMVKLVSGRSNVYVDTPGKSPELGLYDLVSISDLFLSARSSAAWELSILGRRVIYLDPSRNPALDPRLTESAVRDGSSSLTLAEVERQINEMLINKRLPSEQKFVARYVIAFTRRSLVPLAPLSLIWATERIRGLLSVPLTRMWNLSAKIMKKASIHHVKTLDGQLRKLISSYPGWYRLPLMPITTRDGLLAQLHHLSNYSNLHHSSEEEEERALRRIERLFPQ